MKRMACLVALLALSTEAWAASPWCGTWVLRDPTSKFRVTMTLEEVGSGWKLTYRIPVPNAGSTAVTSVMTVETALDGKDALTLVDGKPAGQTMAIRKIDDYHTSAVIKMQGKQTGSSTSELSPDGKVIKSENDVPMTSPDGAVGKQVQYWDKQ